MPTKEILNKMRALGSTNVERWSLAIPKTAFVQTIFLADSHQRAAWCLHGKKARLGLVSLISKKGGWLGTGVAANTGRVWWRNSPSLLPLDDDEKPTTTCHQVSRISFKEADIFLFFLIYYLFQNKFTCKIFVSFIFDAFPKSLSRLSSVVYASLLLLLFLLFSL